MLNEVQIEKILNKYSVQYEDFIHYIEHIITVRMELNEHIKSINTQFSMQEAFKKTQDLNKLASSESSFKSEIIKLLGNDLMYLSTVVYGDSKSLYLNPINLKENKELFANVKSTIDKAKLALLELIKDPVFVYNNKVYKPSEFYSTVIQDSLLNRDLLGHFKTIRNASKRLLNAQSTFMSILSREKFGRITSGITAIRNNVLNSIKNVISKITNFISKDVKSDGIELSAHVFPAPDHAPVQGKQFSNEEFAKMQNGQDFVDVKGNHYSGFPRPIMAWNCRHYTKPIIIGKTKPEHTEEELQKILDDNEKGYTTKDGKHYTLYECTQIQRGYERRIREAKSQLNMFNNLKDNVSASKYKSKVMSLTNQYKEFSKACGIAPNIDRLRVKDY